MGNIFRNPVIRDRYIPKVVKHEQSLQLQICRYLDLAYPHVIYRSDFASGLHLTPYQAKLHARMQSGRAFPDIFIYFPRLVNGVQYAGLALELKKEGTTIMLKNGNMTKNPHIREQADMLKRLNDLGYLGRFALGFDKTVRIIDWYFGKPQAIELPF